MGYSIGEMALCLGVPKATYQCWDNNRTPTPEHIRDKMLKIQAQDREFMAALPARLDAVLAVEFPHGIPSEITKNADDNFS